MTVETEISAVSQIDPPSIDQLRHEAMEALNRLSEDCRKRAIAATSETGYYAELASLCKDEKKWLAYLVENSPLFNFCVSVAFVEHVWRKSCVAKETKGVENGE